MRVEEGKSLTPKVLFEDSELLVIDKPSGIVVDRNNTSGDGTVEEWAERRVKGVQRAGIVHRIDKETSGVLVIAKTPEVFRELQRQFKAREVEKTYVALVHGRVVPPEGVIRAPVGRLPWNRERFGVLPGGREAETKYKVLSIENKQSLTSLRVSDKKEEEFSLVEFYPKTGRTHQIRVHAKSLGHPVVGDTFYAGRKTSRNDRKWCPRLFLHAAKITFTHPGTGERMTVEAPLPEELKKVLTFDI